MKWTYIKIGRLQPKLTHDEILWIKLVSSQNPKHILTGECILISRFIRWVLIVSRLASRCNARKIFSSEIKNSSTSGPRENSLTQGTKKNWLTPFLQISAPPVTKNCFFSVWINRLNFVTNQVLSLQSFPFEYSVQIESSLFTLLGVILGAIN